jgi:phage baseplate assembly protein W
VDFEGHLSEEAVDRALRKLEPRVRLLKVLGSYPMAEPRALNAKPEQATPTAACQANMCGV